MAEFLSAGRARSVVFALSLAAASLLVACGTTKDDTAGMATSKLYEEAREEAASGNWERAAKLFEKLEARTAGTPLAQQASIELAYAQYKSGEKAAALATIERYIKLNPSSPGLDYAFYLQGLINFNENLGLLGSLARQDMSERDQQASRDSYQSFRQLVTLFPNSKYAPDAALRMGYIVNSLAQYEVHVARYYYTRGAFVAAANRAKNTLEEFSNAPATEEALYIMVKSYDQLALPQLRDDAERVLVQNFPDSRFIRNGFVGPSKPWWQVW